MAPALGGELPLDFSERNPRPAGIGSFGLFKDARQSAIFQQFGKARKIIFGHNDKAPAIGVGPDFGFQFQHVGLLLIIGFGTMHDAMYDQERAPRLKEHTPIAHAQAPAGRKIHQTLHVPAHILAKHIQLFFDPAGHLRRKALDIVKSLGPKFYLITHDNPTLTDSRSAILPSNPHSKAPRQARRHGFDLHIVGRPQPRLYQIGLPSNWFSNCQDLRTGERKSRRVGRNFAVA